MIVIDVRTVIIKVLLKSENIITLLTVVMLFADLLIKKFTSEVTLKVFIH